MEFAFKADNFKDLFHNTVASYLEDETSATDDMNSPHNLLAAMDQAIEVMSRADAGSMVKSQINVESRNVLEEKNITQIGQYALDTLEGMDVFVQNKTGKQDRDLLRFSLPLALWVARHGGKLTQIDMIVNSLAAYANEVAEIGLVSELAGVIKEIIEACDIEVSKDIDKANMMRPWRILNLNYGIVATRSHQPKIIEQAYDALVKNLPQDARGFFKEGLQQMDIIGYPDEVREVVERYNKMWGSESVLH